MAIHISRKMSTLFQTEEAISSETVTALANLRNDRGEGRGEQHLVRLNSTISGLLMAAKPSEQTMVSFLRECAVEVALQRLEASQK